MAADLKAKYGAASPTRKHPFTLRFCWSSPATVLATFGGAGAMRPGPGTWGTLAGEVVFAVFASVVPTWGWVALAVLFCVLGAFAADAVAEKTGIEDHGGVVIDEVVAVWLVCAFVPAGWPWWVAAFAAFRVFDILKFWPVSWLDRHMKNGWGVMIDDLFAALYAWLTIRIAAALLGFWPV